VATLKTREKSAGSGAFRVLSAQSQFAGGARDCHSVVFRPYRPRADRARGFFYVEPETVSVAAVFFAPLAPLATFFDAFGCLLFSGSPAGS